MDYLWTPWRFQYVSTADQAGLDCMFCFAHKETRDRELLVLHRANLCLVLLNRYPYSTGHLLLAPYRHIALLEEASRAEQHELMELTAHCQQALRSTYQPEGFNLGMNLGHCAGAGVDKHIHMHLLPRWAGDTNFMTVAGETRVVPEELDVTYQKLHTFF